MRIYDDITPALQAILRSWSTNATCCWVSFPVERNKLDEIADKLATNYGTNLSSEKRRAKKNNNLPTAWACSLPVIGQINSFEVMLMASEKALDMKVGPFSTEKWLRKHPEISEFEMFREIRENGEHVWTWRIRAKTAEMLNQNFIALVKKGNAEELKRTTHHAVRFYPMFGGIRRQFRRMLSGAKKLWVAQKRGDWPGPDPEHLPAMVGFRKETVKQQKEEVSTVKRKIQRQLKLF